MLERQMQLPQPPVGAALGLFNLSRSYGRLEDALHWAREFARTAPAEQGALPGLLEADVWARLGRPSEALALIEKATIDELPSGWQDSLEITQRRLGRTNEAVRALSPRGAPRASEDPRNAALARARILSGDFATGAAIFKGRFPLERAGGPATVDSWQAFAYALQQLGRADEARAQLEALLALQQQAVAAGRPGEPDLRVQHALTLALLGRDDEALALFADARRLGWVDHYFVRNDPRWDRLARDPRLRDVLDAAAADVARQAARMRLDASSR
jgi:tetratricopeptide (TPR) repeat protein